MMPKLLLVLFLLVYPVTVRADLSDPRVSVIGEALKEQVAVTGLDAVHGNGGLLEVALFGRNRESSYLRLEARVEWFDVNGRKIRTILSRWTKFPARGRSEFRFTAVAPGPDAVDFSIFIRKGA
jgi:hypothetical protein